MLYISLIASAILLFVVNLAHFRKSSPSLTSAVAGVVLGICPMCLTCVMPPVALQALLLFLGSLFFASFAVRARYFLLYSCLITIVIYGCIGLMVARDLEALRRLYPREALAKRLPSRRPVAVSGRLSAKDNDYLANVEKDMSEEQGGDHLRGLRQLGLRQLHEEKLAAFVDSPGFGQMRMSGMSLQRLATGLREEKSIPQPGPRDTWSLSSELPGPAPRELDPDPLQRLHLKGSLDFVNPRGFGLLLKRKQLAGFQAHHFSEVPAASPWTIQTIDLVGLVVHEEPIVYVSENLPKMSELRKAPTRALDIFEAAGLEALRAGENIYVRSTPQGLRMLGGVRSAEQCTQCHGGARGDLLGAFSYSLQSSGSKDR